MITRAILNERLQLVGYLEPVTDADELDDYQPLVGQLMPHELRQHLLLIAGECDLPASETEPRFCWSLEGRQFMPVQMARPDFVVAVFRLIEALDELEGFELPPETRAWFDWTEQRGIENVRSRAAQSAGEVTGQ